jgi:hypothetical protein
MGTVARVPLNVVVYLSKVWKIQKKLFDKVIASALVTTYWVILSRRRILCWFQNYKLTLVTKCTYKKLFKKLPFLVIQ